MEGTCNDDLIHLGIRDDQKFKHVVKGIVQNLLNADRLEYQQLLQEACSVFDHPLGKEMIPNAQAKTTLVQL